ncbi:MAG: VanZ family protein [Oscillospiraceae bacterium]|nr:VanZ family protein [Oscillospiraceae bacterium]
MAAIFYFSSQSADESSELSGALTRGLFGADGTEIFMEFLEMIVRKSAHIAIYAVLAFCVTNTIRQLTKSKRLIFCISAGWCSFYAAADEFHQYFVPGRACMWQDWIIDTIGALIGIGAVFFVMRLKNKHKKI